MSIEPKLKNSASEQGHPSRRNTKMKLIKVEDYQELSRKAAEIVADRMNSIENPVLGLATGSTPEGLYQLLVEKNKQGEIDFSNTTTFNLDEYIGLPYDDENSYHYFMEEHLFRHVNLKPENTHVPSGMTDDLMKECRDFEAAIQAAGYIDLQLLGIGKNGHVGFNEPGTSFEERTHITELKNETILANARFFESIDEVPTKAITMGIGTILDSKEILMIISGESKRDAVTKLLEGSISEDLPASSLHKHPNATVIIDAAAWGDN
jgi:glucosamine-6-phosphate deaminase